MVEGVRAFDGKSYGDLVAQWKECLASPGIDDPDSAARRRLEDLALSLRDVYCTKVSVCWIGNQQTELQAQPWYHCTKLAGPVPRCMASPAACIELQTVLSWALKIISACMRAAAAQHAHAAGGPGR